MVHSKCDFCFLNKFEKEQWLPGLFELLYENMHAIAPSVLSYEQEKQEWLAAVSPALDKAPRQIVLCCIGGELAGFVQYYIREKMLMVEEFQLKRKYHRTTVFLQFCKYLASMLPDDLETIEAYADSRNLHSIRLMGRLGMEPCVEEKNAPFVHLCGKIKKLYDLFG